MTHTSIFRRSLLATLLALTVAHTASAQTPGVSDNEILIGEVLMLSGPAAFIGKSAYAGSKLAAAEINAAGGINGRKLRVLYEDDGYVPARSVSAMRKLIDVDRVFAVTGTTGERVLSTTCKIQRPCALRCHWPPTAGVVQTLRLGRRPEKLRGPTTVLAVMRRSVSPSAWRVASGDWRITCAAKSTSACEKPSVCIHWRPVRFSYSLATCCEVWPVKPDRNGHAGDHQISLVSAKPGALLRSTVSGNGKALAIDAMRGW